MNIEEIKAKWNLQTTNKQASVDMWDSMANSFGDYELPETDSDSFWQLLHANHMFRQNGLALDVGCGAGQYALAAAGCCRHVTGLDLSSRMIAEAQNKQAHYGIANVDFHCADWHELDLAAAGYLHKFDLVMAHMTPAVQSAETFMKLSAASRDWCVMAKPIRRLDPVANALQELLGINGLRTGCDEDIRFAFDILWQQGCLPHLHYEKQVWHMRKTIAEAYGFYINRLKTWHDMTDAEEEMAQQYLRSVARKGYVYEDVHTTIATLYWQV